MEKESPFVLTAVVEKKEEILRALRDSQTVIVAGQTATGKTTGLPIMLLEAGYAEEGMIACTEPRIVAAIRPAKYVAESRNTPLGEETGYQVRFDKVVRDTTKIKFVTEGILMKEAETDPWLEQYTCFIVDEVHERSLWTDLFLAYAKALLKKRPELRLILSSATSDVNELCRYFGGAKVVNVMTRRYPINVEYHEPAGDWKNLAVVEVQEIIQSKKPGHILIFCPGIAEINWIVKGLLSLNLPATEILPLYADLDSKEQEKVFQPFDGRKVIVATNIAETSVTLDCSWVIDSGLAREVSYDAPNDLTALFTKKNSRASCDQRAGRSGRTQPGTCLRLYSRDDYLTRSAFSRPKIQCADLANFVLAVKVRGVDDVRQLDLLTAPPDALVHAALRKLRRLGIVDAHGRVTDFGYLVDKISLDVTLASLVLKACELGCVSEALTIAAFLSVRDVFLRDLDWEEKEAIHERQMVFLDSSSDFVTMLNIMDIYEDIPRFNRTNWCLDHGFNPRYLGSVAYLKHQLTKRLKQIITLSSSHNSRDELNEKMALTFKDNLLAFHQDGNYIRIDGLGNIRIPQRSMFRNVSFEYLVTSGLINIDGKIYTQYISVVKPEWLKQIKENQADNHSVMMLDRAKTDSCSVPCSTFKAKGVLSVMPDDSCETKKIYVDVDLARNASKELRIVKNNSLIIEEAELSLGQLGFSAETRAALEKSAIYTFREIPRSMGHLSDSGLEGTALAEVAKVLQRWGCWAQDYPLLPTGAPGSYDLEDDTAIGRLWENFFEKPITVLQFSRSTTAKLTAASILTVHNLLQQSEKYLLHNFGDDVWVEIKDKLERFGLPLFGKPISDRKDQGGLAHQLFLKPRIDRERSPEELKELLGDNLPFFKSFRQASTLDERIAWRNKITEKNIGLVWRLAHLAMFQLMIIRDPAVDGYDLAQEGTLGLMRSIGTYDYNLGYAFSSFACHWIEQSMRRMAGEVKEIPIHLQNRIHKIRRISTQLRDQGKEVTSVAVARIMKVHPNVVERALIADIFWQKVYLDAPTDNSEEESQTQTVADTIADPHPLEDIIIEKVLKSRLSKVVSQILDRVPLLAVEKQVLELYFGLNGHDSHTLEQIGKLLGVSRERIRQRLEGAEEKLRTKEIWEQTRHYTGGLQEPPSPESVMTLNKIKQIFDQLRFDSEIDQRNPAGVLEKVAQSFTDVTVQDLVRNDPDTEAKETKKDLEMIRELAIALLWIKTALSKEEIKTVMNLKSIYGVSTAIKRLQRKIQRGGSTANLYQLRYEVLGGKPAAPLAEIDEGGSMVNPLEVVEYLAHQSGFTLAMVLKKDRRAKIVKVRQEAVATLKDDFGLSFPEIGRLLQRDHTSILNLYYKGKETVG